MFERFLWHAYGYVYDGLLSFYPYKKLVNDVTKQVLNEPSIKILDLGCGTGNVLHEISKNAPDTVLTGVDASASMLKAAHKKVPSAIFVSKPCMTYLKAAPNAAFDCVVLTNFVYTVAPADRQLFWHELLRVVRPGGRVVIADPEYIGQTSVVRQHLANDKWWRLFSPKLIAVSAIDSMIDRYILKGRYELSGSEKIMQEVVEAGAHPVLVGKTYGTDAEGLDALITVTKPVA